MPRILKQNRTFWLDLSTEECRFLCLYYNWINTKHLKRLKVSVLGQVRLKTCLSYCYCCCSHWHFSRLYLDCCFYLILSMSSVGKQNNRNKSHVKSTWTQQKPTQVCKLNWTEQWTTGYAFLKHTRPLKVIYRHDGCRSLDEFRING